MTTVNIYDDGNGAFIQADDSLNWTDARNGAGTRTMGGGDGDYQIGAYYDGDVYYSIARGFISFDTSTIPESATISLVKLYLYGAFEYSDGIVTVLNGTQANTLTIADWASFDGSSLGEVAIAAVDQYYNGELSVGSVTKGGTTKLAFLEKVFDYANNEPLVETTGYWVDFYNASGAEGTKPYLEITYTEGDPIVAVRKKNPMTIFILAKK